MSGLRWRLREATHDAHQKAEAAMALAERCDDRAAYRTLLCELWGIYAPLEAALSGIVWAPTGSVFDRSKAQRLRRDLISLGVPSRRISALPQRSELPSILSPADAMGVLYVLEGATLGGQIILRQVTSKLGLTAQSGAQFFAGYGASTGQKWRDFVSALERFDGDAARVERAARATFACFIDWMREREASRIETGKLDVC